MMSNENLSNSQEIISKKIESKTETPEVLISKMLQQGDKDVGKLKTQIDSLVEEMSWEQGNESSIAQLEALKQNLETAYTDLSGELEAIDEQWGVGEHEKAVGSEVSVEKDEFDEQGFVADLDNVLSSADFNVEEFNRLKEQVNVSASATEMMKSALEDTIGKKYADLLMNDKEFAKVFDETMNVLGKPLMENGPSIMSERNLKNVMAVIEVLGKETANLLEVVNLNRYLPGIDFASNRDVLDVTSAVLDMETGEFNMIQFDIGMDGDYESEVVNEETGEKESKNEPAMIQRSFKLSREKNQSGETIVKKSVHHELLRIPDSLQGSGVAAKITQESLGVYDKASLDEITLNASLERGGYAWAVYGYGWNEDKMALEAYKEQQAEQAMIEFDVEKTKQSLQEADPVLSNNEAEKRAKALLAGNVERVKAGAVKRFEELNDEIRMELLTQHIQKIVVNTKNDFIRISKEAGLTEEDIGDVIKEYDDMLNEPQSVTPQRLAKIGKDGPFLRIGENAEWLTEEVFLEAVDKGEDKEISQMKGRFHAGKIGMSQTQWHGKMELKSNGAQKGLNREILEERLMRAIKI
jgi:hypothetical protein